MPNFTRFLMVFDENDRFSNRKLNMFKQNGVPFLKMKHFSFIFKDFEGTRRGSALLFLTTKYWPKNQEIMIIFNSPQCFALKNAYFSSSSGDLHQKRYTQVRGHLLARSISLLYTGEGTLTLTFSLSLLCTSEGTLTLNFHLSHTYRSHTHRWGDTYSHAPSISYTQLRGHWL